jgi:DNA-binding CsgD family transcriptional regulator
MSFAENCAGTNAISLSIKLKKEVYTLPEHHYCTFLGNSHIYARPIFLTGSITAYLAFFSHGRPIAKELVALSALLGQCVENALLLKDGRQYVQDTFGVARLSGRQREVLLLLARGMTDKAAAIELNVCYDTVKYHKRNIFKILDADCTVQAVVKAIKQHQISTDEIEI